MKTLLNHKPSRKLMRSSRERGQWTNHPHPQHIYSRYDTMSCYNIQSVSVLARILVKGRHPPKFDVPKNFILSYIIIMYMYLTIQF